MAGLPGWSPVRNCRLRWLPFETVGWELNPEPRAHGGAPRVSGLPFETVGSGGSRSKLSAGSLTLNRERMAGLPGLPFEALVSPELLSEQSDVSLH